MPHQGEMLQAAIKSSGLSITRIVEELGITRPTIYRKFKEEILDVSFVKNIGQIIGHDFSNDFAITQQPNRSFVTPVTRHVPSASIIAQATSITAIENDPAKQLLYLQAKYINLLEAYNELLLKMYVPK